MTEKNEALRLVEFYEELAEAPPKSPENSDIRKTAANLRRLVAQRDALLEAAKEAEPMLQAMLDNIRNTLPQYTKMSALDKLRAAIKAVEEGA